MVIFHWWCCSSKRGKNADSHCGARVGPPIAPAGTRGCLWAVCAPGSGARCGQFSPHGRGAVLPPPDSRDWEETLQPPRFPSSPHPLFTWGPRVPFTLSRRHALAWPLPQMPYILLGHLMMRFYFIIYISAAAHKLLHSGSNGLSFSCHCSLKCALN